jgi:hypothetical protein
MPLLKRHKYILTCLGIYWPVLFILTHIPVPQIARQSGMSDKTMHVLAYMGLVFFCWYTINPYSRVNWKRVKVWVILGVMVWYGAFDEYLQARMGRSGDIRDFIADLAGTVIGLVIMTILPFWKAALAVSAIFIFAVTNLSKIAVLYPQMHVNIIFHFISYAVFTLVWIQNMHRDISQQTKPKRWFLITLSGPVALLFIVKLFSLILGKQIWAADYFTALTAIVSATAVSWVVTFRHEKEKGGTP